MKRYGVYMTPGDPDYYALKRNHETWQEAREEYYGLKGGPARAMPWVIWDFASDPPRDVTDADPDQTDTPGWQRTWLMCVSAYTPTIAAFKAGEELERIGFEPEGKQRHYHVTIEDVTPEDVTPEEEPQWWFYQLGEWRHATIHAPALLVDQETHEVTSAIVKARESDRDQVMEELRLAWVAWEEAIGKAGGEE